MAREVGIGVRHAACWNRGEDSIDCATGANRLYSVPNFAKRRGGRIQDYLSRTTESCCEDPIRLEEVDGIAKSKRDGDIEGPQRNEKLLHLR